MNKFIFTPARRRQQSLRMCKGGIAMSRELLRNMLEHHVLPPKLSSGIELAISMLGLVYRDFNKEVGWKEKK
jgi:hypothetical protein